MQGVLEAGLSRGEKGEGGLVCGIPTLLYIEELLGQEAEQITHFWVDAKTGIILKSRQSQQLNRREIQRIVLECKEINYGSVSRDVFRAK